MYDHSSFDQQHYSLKGFLNSKVLDWTPEQRKKGVIQELKNIYGDLFPSEFEYFDKIWIDDQNVSSRSYDYTPPKQYNSEPVLRNIEWNNSLFFSGTETSPYYAGYMEGAFFSAIKTIKSLHF